MSRWLILLSAFALWLFCVGLVYVNFRPREEKDVSPAARAALERLFAETAENSRSWRIFLDVKKLKESKLIPFSSGNSAPGAPKPAVRAVTWNGYDETGLTEVGRFDMEVKRRDQTRLMQTGDLHVDIPREVDLPPPASLKFINLTTWSDISMDEGLKVFSSVITTGLRLEANSLGVRQGSDLSLTTNVTMRGQQILSKTVSVPIGMKSAPNSEPLPFQANRDVTEGAEWEIALLDTELDLSGNAQPRAAAIKVRCTGRTQIMLEGDEKIAYVVSTEDGSARAWYSADGVVLKQAFKFAGMLEIVAVRQEPKKPAKRRDAAKHKTDDGEQWRQGDGEN